MALIDWTDEFTVDNGPIDDQHRNLVEIVNKFDEANRKGKGTRVMAEILDNLMGYTQEHFSFEENIMAESGYAKLKLHKSQHRQLIQKLERFQFDFNSGKRVTNDMKELLKYWLTSHILKEDKAFAVSLESETVEA